MCVCVSVRGKKYEPCNVALRQRCAFPFPFSLVQTTFALRPPVPPFAALWWSEWRASSFYDATQRRGASQQVAVGGNRAQERVGRRVAQKPCFSFSTLTTAFTSARPRFLLLVSLISLPANANARAPLSTSAFFFVWFIFAAPNENKPNKKESIGLSA